jgi:hypothetical protein
MKRVFFLCMMLYFGIHVHSQALPWPTAVSEALYLPFGLKWFQEINDVKKAFINYGEANCTGQTCIWMKDTEDGTAAFKLDFHFNTLVGFKLDYTIKKNAGIKYLERLEKLKKSTSEWYIKDLRKFPIISETAGDHYTAEIKDSRMTVKWREGEHSIFISIEMRAK